MTSDKHYMWHMAGAESFLGKVHFGNHFSIYHAGDGGGEYEDDYGWSGEGFGSYGECEGDGMRHSELTRPDDYYDEPNEEDEGGDDEWAAMVKKLIILG